MPSLCRHGDLGSTGHKCTRKIGTIASQRTVFANGIPVSRNGDKSMKHLILVPCPPPAGKKCCVPHKSQINRGSNAVFVQGIGVAREGDSHDAGEMLPGSFNVFAG